MVLNVNLLMDQVNLNVTLINRCHIKLDHVMLLKKNGVVRMDHDVIFCIRGSMLRDRIIH
jgi:hypothetical protein